MQQRVQLAVRVQLRLRQPGARKLDLGERLPEALGATEQLAILIGVGRRAVRETHARRQRGFAEILAQEPHEAGVRELRRQPHRVVLADQVWQAPRDELTLVDQARLDEALQMLVYQSEASMDPEPTNTATDIQALKKYVVCTKDKIAPPKKQYEWAAAADAEVAELDCGHSPFLLEKETGMLVDIIEGVACA